MDFLPTVPIQQVGSQSAISQLLATLTQPQPSATPSAPAMPQPGQVPPGQMPVGNMSAPPPQTPPLNVPLPPDNSITGRIRVLLSGAHSSAQNLLTGSAPQGYQSLLTPQEMQQDRPGILESILGGGIFAPLFGRALYQHNLAQNVNMNQLAEQIQAQRLSMAQNARVLQARNQMASLFPLSQNPSLDELRTNLAKQYDYAVSHGDVEMAKDIGARLNDVLKAPASMANRPFVVGSDLVSPTGQLLYAGTPKHQGAAQVYVSPDGTQFKGFFGDETPPKGWKPWAKPSALGMGGTGFGSGGIGMVARQYAAIAGMENADQAMTPFETSVLNGTANYTGLDYYKGMWSKMYDAEGHIDPAVHAAVYAKLNAQNPALANYLASAEQWALEDSQLSGRPSDFRTKLDAYISAIGPNAQKSTIQQRQDFRRTRLKALADVSPAMKAMLDRAAAMEPGAGGGTGMGVGTPSPVPGPTTDTRSEKQKLYDEAVAFLQKQKKTAKQILTQLGPRPNQ